MVTLLTAYKVMYFRSYFAVDGPQLAYQLVGLGN